MDAPSETLFLGGQYNNLPFSLLTVLLIILYQLWNDLLNGAIDDIIGYGIDRSIGIVVDRDDDTTVLHTSNMLNLARYSACNIDFWMDGNTSLTNLTVVVYPSCINCCATGTNLSMKLFS